MHCKSHVTQKCRNPPTSAQSQQLPCINHNSALRTISNNTTTNQCFTHRNSTILMNRYYAAQFCYSVPPCHQQSCSSQTLNPTRCALASLQGTHDTVCLFCGLSKCHPQRVLPCSSSYMTHYQFPHMPYHVFHHSSTHVSHYALPLASHYVPHHASRHVPRHQFHHVSPHARLHGCARVTYLRYFVPAAREQHVVAPGLMPL